MLSYSDILRLGRLSYERIFKTPSFATVLKAQRGRRFDESRVNRAPAGAPGSIGGQFTAAAGAYAAGGTAEARERQREGMTSVRPGMQRGVSGLSYSKLRHAGYDADVMRHQRQREKEQAKGKGFKNPPHGEGLPEPQTGTVANTDPKILSTLGTGTATDSRPLGGGGANASVIATFEGGVEAVYKPERGENWTATFCNRDINEYVTNRDFSLAEREAFAYEVDSLLGLGLVPETVLRKQVDESHIDVNTEGDNYGGGGYDSYEARQRYESYKQGMIDDDRIMDEVGERFEAKFREAQDDHVSDLESRREELQEIWNELKEDYPEGDTPYGRQSALREHPVLPMGSAGEFERREPRILSEVNPIDLMDEADVDPTAKFSGEEKTRLRAKMKEYLEDGYRELGEVDEKQAKEHLDRDDWYQAHEDTEAAIRDSVFQENVQSYTNWREEHGYADDDGGGDGGDRNPDAPHPNGGSLQNYRSGADSYGDVTDEGGARLAVLDYVVGTMDRHGQNLMFEDDMPVAIDNGYSMPAVGGDDPDGFTFRSDGVGEWKRNGGNIPESERSRLQSAFDKTDWQALVDRHPGMNADEREAFLGRVENMKTALQTPDGLYKLWRRLSLM